MRQSAFWQADLLVKDYKKDVAVGNRSAMLVIKSYINGIGEGFAWANSVLKENGQPRLYCQPENVGLTEQNYLDILDHELQKWSPTESNIANRKTLKSTAGDSLEACWPDRSWMVGRSEGIR